MASNRTLGLLQRIWGTLHEPRAVTAAITTAYAICALGGIALIAIPLTGRAPTDWPDHAARVMAGASLIGSGALGVPSAWTGAWWIERLAALGSIYGLACLILYIPLRHDLGQVEAVAITALAAAAALLTARLVRVRTAPYAPGTGPLTPIQTIHARSALREAEPWTGASSSPSSPEHSE